MSENTSPEAVKPEAAAATAEKTAAAAEGAPAPEKPAPPPEPPFTVDELLSCTARFSHKAWYLFYNQRKDMKFIREVPVRASLEARTDEGTETLQQILSETGVGSISRSGRRLSFTATFENIQKVIKHPETFMVDAIRI